MTPPRLLTPTELAQRHAEAAKREQDLRDATRALALTLDAMAAWQSRPMPRRIRSVNVRGLELWNAGWMRK